MTDPRLLSLLHFADRGQILVEFLLVTRADRPTDIVRIGKDRIEHALITATHLVLEQSIKGERRIQLERGRCRRRAPRNMRAVEHRIILVHAGIGLLATEHETGHFG